MLNFASQVHAIRGRAGRRASAAVVAGAACVAAIVVPQVTAKAIVPAGIKGYSIVAGSAVTVPVNSAGAATVATASCASGKVVISGGVLSHSATTTISTSYPSSTSAWTITATPTVNVNYVEHVTAYAVCANSSSLPGYNVASLTNQTVGPNTYYGQNFNISDAYCAANQYVLGGGFSTADAQTEATIERPTSDNQAWEVELHRNSAPVNGSSTYDVFAICVPTADISSYTIVNAPPSGTTALTVADPFNTAGSPFCGAGTLAVGGGGTNHDQTNGYLSSISPDSSGKYWLVTDFDTSPPVYGENFYPVAICVTASMTLPTTLSNLVATLPYGPFSAKLTSPNGPVVGVTVQFTTGSGPGTTVICSGVTNAMGVASCSYSLAAPNGQAILLALTMNHFQWNAVFAGNSDYLPSQASQHYTY